mmetsp:Transcript_41225/g.66051  ORF Transcript_41225/g.66051 Transcript_41225/m.66051 type:complete len:440 (-) Transcript_41225:423-1742(-)
MLHSTTSLVTSAPCRSGSVSPTTTRSPRGAVRARRTATAGSVVTDYRSHVHVTAGLSSVASSSSSSHVRLSTVAVASLFSSSTASPGRRPTAGRYTTRRQALDGNGGAAPPLSVNTETGNDGTKKTKTPTPDEPVPSPPLRVAAGIAAVGCIESGYLAYEKLTGGSVTCPLDGCQTALSSSYSTLGGVPLSAYGAAAYGLVAALAWWGAGMADQEDEVDAYARARVLVFLAGAGLAGVSSYLLYVLAGPLGGAECVYCLTSAAISFTLFSIGFSGLSPRETGRVAPAAVALFAVTVLSLSLVLGGAEDGKANINTLTLAYTPLSIEAKSTQYSRQVAAHLRATGAKMYGAFWCSHCIDQKETFGAGTEIPYVECFPSGWEKGTAMAPACAAANVTGFPTWVMGDGTRFEGERTLEELAKASGMVGQLDAASMAADFMAK